MTQEAAIERFEALKTATLELSATCSRPSASEAEIRKGMAELGCAIHEMEEMWQYMDANRRKTYEDQANATLELALKRVKQMNTRIRTVEEAIGTRIPYQERINTRSQGKLLTPSRLDAVTRHLNDGKDRTTAQDDTRKGNPEINNMTVLPNGNGNINISVNSQGTDGDDSVFESGRSGTGSGTEGENANDKNGPEASKQKDRPVSPEGKSRSPPRSERDKEIGKDRGRSKSKSRSRSKSRSKDGRNDKDRCGNRSRSRSKKRSKDRESKEVSSSNGDRVSRRNRSSSRKTRSSSRNKSRSTSRHKSKRKSSSHKKKKSSRRSRSPSPRQRSSSRKRSSRKHKSRKSRSRSRDKHGSRRSRSSSRKAESSSKSKHASRQGDSPSSRSRSRSKRTEKSRKDRSSSRSPCSRSKHKEKSKRNRSSSRNSRSRSKQKEKSKRKERSSSRESRSSKTTSRSDKSSKTERSSRRDRSRSRSKSGKRRERSRDRSSSRHHKSRKDRKSRDRRKERSRSRQKHDRNHNRYSRSRSRPRDRYDYRKDRYSPRKDHRYYNSRNWQNGEPRDRASSWGQSQYYPQESQFVAPSAEKSFASLQFPSNWAVPTEREFKRYFDRVDVLPMLGKPQAFGMFDGQVANYPGWQENFYRVVHVQAIPLIHKVSALDQAVKVDIKNKYFKDLTSSAEDYLLRIRRLEDKFGGPGKHMSTMVQRIKAISEVGKDYGKVQEAVFALERFLESRYCKDPNDPLTAEMIRPYMRPEVREQYRSYKHDHQLDDTAVSILKFLRKMLEIREDEQRKDKSYKIHKVKKVKKEAGKEKEKDKKANYQFFNSPSSDETESSEDSFANESFYDSSEDEGQLHWQRQDTTCDFCKGLHNIFQCLKFFCELSHSQRRKWVIKEKRCPFCLKTGHKRSKCDRKRMCRFCKGEHNSCLHVEPKKEVSEQSGEGSKNKGSKQVKGQKRKTKEKASKSLNNQTQANTEDESSSESDEANIHSSRRSGKVGQQSISLTTFVACIRNPSTGNLTKVNALADSGADHTILSARAARDLGLWRDGEGSNYYVKGHGGSRGCYLAQKFDIELLNTDGERLRDIRVSSYESPCGDLQLESWGELKNNWKHLRDLPLTNPVGDGLVDLVLGSSALDLMEALYYKPRGS